MAQGQGFGDCGGDNSKGVRHVKQHEVIRFRSVGSLSCGSNDDDDDGLEKRYRITDYLRVGQNKRRLQHRHKCHYLL